MLIYIVIYMSVYSSIIIRIFIDFTDCMIIKFSIEVTFPLDITKTRLQIQGERASTIPSTTATNVPYRGMVRTAVGIGEDKPSLL